jgi:hypothetical protein
MAPGAALLGALENGGIATAVRESMWLYPLIEIAHIVGFTILVGAVILFDLRVLGVSKRVPVRMLARHLLPWSAAALLLIVPAGLLLFATEATALIDNRAFVTKMVLLMLALTNAAAFHMGAFRGAEQWDQGMTAPRAARLHALASIVIWIGVIACGRLIAYV